MQPSIIFDLSQELSEFIHYPNIPRVMPRAFTEHIYTAPSPISLLAVSKESREYALKGVNFEFEAHVPNPPSSQNYKSISEDLRGVASCWEMRWPYVDIPTLRIQVGRKVPECITRLRFEIDVVFIDTSQFWILEQWLPEFFFEGVRYLAMLFETWSGTRKEILKFTGLTELILFAEPSIDMCMWPTRGLKQDQKSRLEHMEESTTKRLEELTRLDLTWSKPRLTIFSDTEAFI
jgi:hypothetical protein